MKGFVGGDACWRGKRGGGLVGGGAGLEGLGEEGWYVVDEYVEVIYGSFAKEGKVI